MGPDTRVTLNLKKINILSCYTVASTRWIDQAEFFRKRRRLLSLTLHLFRGQTRTGTCEMNGLNDNKKNYIVSSNEFE